MDELTTKLDQITNSRQLDYVLARAEVSTDKAGYLDAGIHKTTFYDWSKETREYLNGLARELKLETALKAKLVLRAATKEAAEVKVSGLKDPNKRIKQSVATEILDRMLGKPVQKIDSKHEVVKPVVVEHVLIHDKEEEEDE